MPGTDPDLDLQELARVIRAGRKRLRLSIQQAALQAELSPTTWGKLEKAATNPTDATLLRVASVIGPQHLLRIFELVGRVYEAAGDELQGPVPPHEARRKLEELLQVVPSLSGKARRVLIDMFDLVASGA